MTQPKGNGGVAEMIDRFAFGSIVVHGRRYTHDIKIVAGRVVPDWWRASGHLVAVSDVQDILASRPDVVVIGRGEPGYMRLSDDLRRYFEKSGIEVIEEKTARAIHAFNRLFKAGRNVAAGFHLTC